MIMARESVFRSAYYSGLFLFFVVFLTIVLFCTFSSINLFSFYLFFEVRIVPTVFIILG
jgi:NADH-ubiquinone oxidoreductase chain 4